MLKATAARTTSQRRSHRPGTPPNGPHPTGAGQRWLFQMTLKHCRPSPAWAIAPPCNPPFPPQTRALHSFLSFLGALIKIPAKSELLPHWPSRSSVLFPTTFLITNIAAHPDSGKYILLRLSPCSRLPGRAGPFVCTESPALGNWGPVRVEREGFQAAHPRVLRVGSPPGLGLPVSISSVCFGLPLLPDEGAGLP